MACSDEVGIEVLVGCNAVHIKFGGKGVDQDGIAAVEGNHDVLVAAVGMELKATSIIGEDAGEGDFVELDSVGAEGWEDGWWLGRWQQALLG